MKLIIYGLLFTILSLPLMAEQNNNITITDRYIREPEQITLYEIEVPEIKEPKFEYTVSREVAIKEVVDFWNYTFNKDDASKTDWRRARFEEYATYLVDNVRYYQSHKERIFPREIDIQLPNSRYVHLIIAQMVYKESSVNPNVVGKKRGEVGFLQVHGTALDGYDKKLVQNTPELGMKLGIRWIAKSYSLCNLPAEYNINHWKGVLAIYGAGEAKAKKNGKCSTNYGFANRRVNAVKNYIFNQIEI